MASKEVNRRIPGRLNSGQISWKNCSVCGLSKGLENQTRFCWSWVERYYSDFRWDRLVVV